MDYIIPKTSQEHLRIILDRLKDYQDYSKEMEIMIQSKILNSKFSDTSEFSDNPDDATSTFNRYNYFLISDKFPQIFRASLLIRIFGYFEYELKKSCESHRYFNGGNISFKDFSGSSDLDKAKTYFKKLGNVNIAELNPEWTYLQSIRDIRNVFTHNEGEILVNSNPRSKKIINLVRSLNHIEFAPYDNNILEKVNDETEFWYSDYGQLIITNSSFLNLLISSIQKLFVKLLDNHLKYGL